MRPPESWRRARATLVIAAIIAVAWTIAAALGINDYFAIGGGFIPARASGLGVDFPAAPVFLTPLTATFVHAGFVHLAFNLLILLFCGRAVENILGPAALVVLFVTGAYAAAAAQYLVGPQDVTPMVGASGAISAIIGTYAILFGRNRVKIANPKLALWVNALWLAAAWVALQLLIGLTLGDGVERIAYAAHIGGFLSGLLLAKPLLIFRYRKA
ncbi:MAG TPA: rhomboid family intramembrane serine protease [Allosphingosinicella sp.]|uniref:rhomboid family intramembrane serine protease n=1 Tax=Allosphingosinicella sp. TaxID=2823234 RepID=UPI002ED7A8FA